MRRSFPASAGYLPFCFFPASPARRSAVRFFAAAADAFFARAERSAGVMVTRLRFPPFEPIAAIAFRIIAALNSFAIVLNDSVLAVRSTNST